MFGDKVGTTQRSVRYHQGRPGDIVELGVSYNETHRTYDDIIVDGRETPVTTYWFDNGKQSRETEDLNALERLLSTIKISRLGEKSRTGRNLSPYQRDTASDL